MQLKNEMEQKKRCNICCINAENTTYLIPYLALYFERLKHVQNFSLIQKIKNLAKFKIDK